MSGSFCLLVWITNSNFGVIIFINCPLRVPLFISFDIGIKHDFPFINIRKVPGEVLKTEVFNISRGTLRMLMNDKIMFDRYYCINSKKTHQKLRKCLRTLFFSLTDIFLRAHAFYKYPRFGRGQVLFLMMI